jgi:hypothetical protein
MKNFIRRDFFKSIAAGGLFALIPRKLYSQENQATTLLPEGTGLINVCDFGAKGDGKTDNTASFRKAINEAAKTGGSIIIPPGVYMTSTLQLQPHIGLIGYPSWSFQQFGGSILRLNDPNANCLLDITGAFGVTINGLCLDGAGLGKDIHGIFLNKPDYGSQEDTPLIERCRISNFTGDAVRLSRVWCFRIRSCMLSFCKGNGLYVRGWDGFIMDNWLTGNDGFGFAATEENASCTLTGNRIEWNKGGGIVCRNGNNYNITGNYIDRSGGPAIYLKENSYSITMTGNVIFRSGKPEWTPDENDSAHVKIENCSGIVLVGNSLRAGRDDGGKGFFSPLYSIIYGGLQDSVIKDNTAYNGCTKGLFIDNGAHGENVVVKDNPGRILKIQ